MSSRNKSLIRRVAFFFSELRQIWQRSIADAKFDGTGLNGPINGARQRQNGRLEALRNVDGNFITMLCYLIGDIKESSSPLLYTWRQSHRWHFPSLYLVLFCS
jgi:hypothetical protein